MRARRSRAVSLLVTSVVLTGLLIPGAIAQSPDAEPAAGPAMAAPAFVDLAEIPVEPPVQPAPPAARELFGADCDTEIEGSRVTAYCHNGYPETDLIRLHVECDRWWDVDGDGAAVAVGPAGRVELTSRCWKEVRSAWVSHERP
ncbi:MULTISPECIES: hypothetical protein [unclassified Streptomyces]|uniref:hypothetical protein n=1 Tax=unclassified Streptomyces TaxID=2593676 RepID=UPI001BECDB0B|nr:MULTISPECIES: hypothetical protein [unclassified Streptomyces]MBT2405842.1 hypothetical protein [Streptomyces sp. ISL-21]MBT2456492.1 hypothetical protein [Streptomyces sp. ISL-86]MBT2613007.1 hypothetical protein [Streptomyces sp. ISL-87]